MCWKGLRNLRQRLKVLDFDGQDGFEEFQDSVGDLKVRTEEASSEGCGGMAVRGLWDSAGAATRWGQEERVLDHLIKTSTWAWTMARADADLALVPSPSSNK
jgi:hypothetical protein